MGTIVRSEDFLRVLRESHLIEEAALESYLEQLRAASFTTRNGPKMALRMIQDGMLTPFQAKRLLAEKHKGFNLIGKYRLLDLLGAGSLGHVFLCDHLFLHQLVAVRILTLGEEPSTESVDHFRRLIRTSVTLDHRHLVRWFEISSAGRLQFMVMEYVDGRNLLDVVQRCGPISIARAAHYICQAVRGLQQAAAAGFVHGDIKPKNLLLDRHGIVKVRDLGLAHCFPAVATADGTDEDLDFFAPEQENQPADVRTDIYALGATLYYLLTGQGPFAGAAAVKVARRRFGEPTPIAEVRADVPDGLARIIHKMLARDPSKRYATLEKVLDALTVFTREEIALPSDEEIPVPCAAIARSLHTPRKSTAANSGTTPHPAAENAEPNGRRLFGAGLLMALGVGGRYLTQGLTRTAGHAEDEE